MPNKCEKEAAMIKAFERLLVEFSPCSPFNRRGQPETMWRIRLDNFFGYSNRRDAGAVLIWDNAYKALSEFKQEREAAEKMLWQPIEAAPKDGTVFLAYQTDIGYYTAHWCGKHNCFACEWDCTPVTPCSWQAITKV